MPSALLRFLMARIGPFLTRAAKSAPGLEARLASALATAGAKAGSTISSITTFAKASPINMALLVTTLASIGVDLSSWWSAAPKDSESKAFVENLSAAASRSSSLSTAVSVPRASSTIRGVADRSVTYEPNLASKEADLAQMANATAWAVRFFGSRAAAENALNYLDFLLSVPSNDRETAFRYLRTS